MTLLFVNSENLTAEENGTNGDGSTDTKPTDVPESDPKLAEPMVIREPTVSTTIQDQITNRDVPSGETSGGDPVATAEGGEDGIPDSSAEHLTAGTDEGAPSAPSEDPNTQLFLQILIGILIGMIATRSG